MEGKPKNLLKGSAGLEIKPGGTYVILVDPMAINVRDLERLQFPFEVNITFIPVIRSPGMSVADTLMVEEEKDGKSESSKSGSD